MTVRTRVVRLGSAGSGEPGLQFAVVVVDLPENLCRPMVKRAEVMLAIRVVVLVKTIKALHLGQYRLQVGLCKDTPRYHKASLAAAVGTEGVVQNAYSGRMLVHERLLFCLESVWPCRVVARAELNWAVTNAPPRVAERAMGYA